MGNDTGMRFPKEPKRQRRKTHAKHSILQKDADRRRCFLCMAQGCHGEHAKGALHKHHIFMGPLRSMSEAEGFFVWLCPGHHRAAHEEPGVNRRLQEKAQRAYESTRTREEFMELTGKSYTTED